MRNIDTNALAQAIAASLLPTIEGLVNEALAAHIDADAPAKVAKPKARKAPAKKAVTREVRSASHTFLGERVGTGSRKLTKANRAAFIAAHAWAKPGFSTAAIRSEVAAGAKVNKGWNVAV